MGYKLQLMNIFYLHKDPEVSAKMHCDKHVVKMIIEYAQMLSTAHRMLDGKIVRKPSRSGKTMVKYYDLYEGADDLEAENTYYHAVHFNHPCNVWIRESHENYIHLYKLFVALCDEYKYRYGRSHMTDIKLREPLWTLPKNIPSKPFTEPPQAMPDYCKRTDPIDAYRTYYIKEKKRFAKWTKRQIPYRFWAA